MILSITGPSGVGKTTLLHNLLREIPKARVLTSVTTRERRPSDEPGEYEYVSDAEFDAMSSRGDFLWEVHPHGKKYATRKDSIDTALREGFYIPVLVVGAVVKLRAYATTQGLADRVRSLYILIDDEAELKKRFVERNDMTEAQIESRLLECRTWNDEARRSGVPFIYLPATKKREEILADAMARIQVPKIKVSQ